MVFAFGFAFECKPAPPAWRVRPGFWICRICRTSPVGLCISLTSSEVATRDRLWLIRERTVSVRVPGITSVLSPQEIIVYLTSCAVDIGLESIKCVQILSIEPER